MFEALLQLREPLSKMNLPVGCPRLSELDWWVLQVGEEVLRPLMLAMVEHCFFSDSQHTFVKGTKDSNKAFLKAQVREGIGTMYLFLIVPHLVST